MKSLRIALIGYGRMGRMIHDIAERRGHQVLHCIDRADDSAWQNLSPEHIDVAIEFTTPEVAADNVRRLLSLGIPVISGTTGWTNELELIRKELKDKQTGSLLWASNFSIGVNLFFVINREVARLMSKVGGYGVSMQEVHHIHKLDAPSGTAITLAETVISEMPERLKGWELQDEDKKTNSNLLPIQSVREGEVPGIHSISYHSEVDCIELKHEAYSRSGFAEGAIVAAEFIAGRKGYYTMHDLLQHFLSQQ